MFGLPHSLKKLLGTAKIHPITFVEIGFRLTGDDCGQVIDNLGSIRDERFRDSRVRDIGRESADWNGAPAGAAGVIVSAIVSRSTDLPPMLTAFCKRLAKFATDHSGCAGHQDIHTAQWIER